MTASVTFFPVDNGDMTLVQLADSTETTILIDIKIREAADDPKDDAPDVAKELRSRLKKDAKGRPFVDVFLLSHPDQDHCLGLEKHFHLGPLSDYVDDDKPEAKKRIVIRELWSSALVFRRATKKAKEEGHVLCSDAQAWATEARRRVKTCKEKDFIGMAGGDRILIMGEDENGKTDDLGPILIKAGNTFNHINGTASSFFSAQLLAPMLADDEADETLTKNNSSVIMNMQIAASATVLDGCKFLTGGDAEVGIWERLWNQYKGIPKTFEYDILQTPHHCSWHTLSHESWSKTNGKAQVSADALKALSQKRTGAFIVASSCPIEDDDSDPPCIGAKREYEKIVAEIKGEFYCTGEYPTKQSPKPLAFTIGAQGPSAPGRKDDGTKAAAFIATSAGTPREHGL